MRATIDTVSLIFALKIPAVEEWMARYMKKIYITDEVYRETFESKGSDGMVSSSQLRPLFERKNPKKIVRTNLGKGELSAISLAQEEKILFITEDRKATIFARTMAIRSVSILSIILRAKEEGRLDKMKAKQMVFGLVENGYYMSTELFSFVLERIEG